MDIDIDKIPIEDAEATVKSGIITGFADSFFEKDDGNKANIIFERITDDSVIWALEKIVKTKKGR